MIHDEFLCRVLSSMVSPVILQQCLGIGSGCVGGSGSTTYPMFKTGTGLRWVGLPCKKCLEQTRERLKK